MEISHQRWPHKWVAIRVTKGLLSSDDGATLKTQSYGTLPTSKTDHGKHFNYVALTSWIQASFWCAIFDLLLANTLKTLETFRVLQERIGWLHDTCERWKNHSWDRTIHRQNAGIGTLTWQELEWKTSNRRLPWELGEESDSHPLTMVGHHPFLVPDKHLAVPVEPL